MKSKQTHLQQWFTESIAFQKAGFTRLEMVNITQLAYLSDLTETTLQEFVLGQQNLSPEHLTKLIVVLKAFGYEPPE